MTSEDPSMTKSVTVQIAPGDLQILKDNAAMLNRLSEYLLIHENITGEEFQDLLNAA